jgi:hypothetical protein
MLRDENLAPLGISDPKAVVMKKNSGLSHREIRQVGSEILEIPRIKRSERANGISAPLPPSQRGNSSRVKANEADLQYFRDCIREKRISLRTIRERIRSLAVDTAKLLVRRNERAWFRPSETSMMDTTLAIRSDLSRIQQKSTSLQEKNLLMHKQIDRLLRINSKLEEKLALANQCSMELDTTASLLRKKESKSENMQKIHKNKEWPPSSIQTQESYSGVEMISTDPQDKSRLKLDQTLRKCKKLQSAILSCQTSINCKKADLTKEMQKLSDSKAKLFSQRFDLFCLRASNRKKQRDDFELERIIARKREENNLRKDNLMNGLNKLIKLLICYNIGLRSYEDAF